MHPRMFVLFALIFSTVVGVEKVRFLETFSSSYGQSFEISKPLYREQSEFSDLTLFENPIFGRVFAVDGLIRVTERDEIIYSEMMAHVPLLAHNLPQDVLILGGGDGTILREVLKHKSVQRVVVLEEDRKIVELTQRYFGHLLNSAFEDGRVHLLIEDPKEYVRLSQERFDVVICNGPTVDCKNLLKENGICVSRTGISFFEREDLLQINRDLKQKFEHVLFYIISIPSHPWGLTAVSWVTNGKYRLSVKTLLGKMADIQGKMQYYNPAIHKAAFRLPQYFFK